ncbi:hypothetical protein KEM55_003275 [Ascosphaera atra]|nr:hypothetical protein KEM55_003275 [Ascosphaera atra]
MEASANSSKARTPPRTRRSVPSLYGLGLAPLHHISDYKKDETNAVEDAVVGSGNNGYNGDVTGNNRRSASRPARSPYHSINGSHHPSPATNYLTSNSVPSTPSILSDSRSSFFNIPKAAWGRGRDEFHEHDHGPDAGRTDVATSRHHHRRATHHHHHPHEQDSEWLLRTGSAFSTYARDTKGQSWLVKRESSTSLVLDAAEEQQHRANSSQTYQQRAASRSRGRSRSGASTPLGRSRHGSRAATDRRHLCMTPLHPSASSQAFGQAEGAGVYADVGDDNAMPHVPRTDSRRTSISNGVFSAFESTPASEFGEAIYDGGEELEDVNMDMRDLKRFRTFGLGSWLDSLLERLLYGVEDEGANEVVDTVGNDPPAPHSRPSSPFGGRRSSFSTEGSTSDSDSDDISEVSSVFDISEHEDNDLFIAEKMSQSSGVTEQRSDSISDISWLLKLAKASLF